MPTILRVKGFRLFFYSNEGVEPAHVHVQYQSVESKFWINPVSLARNMGMNVGELRKAFEIVSKHESLIGDKWNEYFRKKN